MITLIWRASALADLKQTINYISERDVLAAERLLAAIEACAERLPGHPFMYRPGGSQARAKRWCIRAIS